MTDQTNREAMREAYARDFSGIDMDFDQHVEVVIGYKAGWQAALKHAQQAVESEREKALAEAQHIAFYAPLIKVADERPYWTDSCKAMAFDISNRIRALKSQQPAQADKEKP